MRGPRTILVCGAIGLSSAAATPAVAEDFEISAATPAAPAPARIIPLASRKRPLADARFTFVSTLPADEPGVRRGAASYDLRLAPKYDISRLMQIKQSLRHRGTGMRDAYLHGASGLRASVGSSYHVQYRASGTGPGRAAGSAALMRLPVGAVNLRDGYESYAPVAMVGYDAYVSDRMKIGVEGGMMVGRSTAMYADETVPGVIDTSHVARNPVADVVMTYAF